MKNLKIVLFFSLFLTSLWQMGFAQTPIKAFLEGSYSNSTGLMNDVLRVNNLLSTTDPYLMTATTTSAVLSLTGNDAIVDWVLVQLRDSGDPSLVVAEKAGLLQRDGDIVDVDGTSALSFTQSGSFYVAVKHRNHIGVRTANAVDISMSVDFSDPSTAFGTDAQQIYGGVAVLWAGDTDSSGRVNAADRANAWNSRNTSGLSNDDVNLNGNINANDRALIWNNRNKTEQF